MAGTELDGKQALRRLIELDKCPPHLTMEQLLELDEAHKHCWHGIAKRLRQLLPDEVKEKERAASLLERLGRQSPEVQHAIAGVLVGGNLLTLEQLADAVGGSAYPDVRQKFQRGAVALMSEASWEELVCLLRRGDNFDFPGRWRINGELTQRAAQASYDQLRTLASMQSMEGSLSQAVWNRLSELMRELGEEELRKKLKSDWFLEQNVAAHLLVNQGKVGAEEAMAVLREDKPEDKAVARKYRCALPGLLAGKTAEELTALLDDQTSGVSAAAAEALVKRAAEQADVEPETILRAVQLARISFPEKLTASVATALQAVPLGELVELYARSFNKLREAAERELKSPERVRQLKTLAEGMSWEELVKQ